MLALLHCVGSDPDLTIPNIDANAPVDGVDGSSPDPAAAADTGVPTAAGEFLWNLVIEPNVDGAGLVAADGAGNVYLALRFSNRTIHLGDTTLVTSSPANKDFAIAKLANEGRKVEWVATITGDKKENVTGITLDAAGDLYATGAFDSIKVTIAGQTLDRGGAPSGFVAKLNGVTGAAIWTRALEIDAPDAGPEVKAFGGPIRATAKGVAFACNFRGDLTNGPSGVVSNRNLIGALVGTLDPATGNITSSQVVSSDVTSGPSDIVMVKGIELDSRGDFYLVGDTTAPAITVGGVQLGSLVNESATSGFVMKLAANLPKTSIWHRLFGARSIETATKMVDVRIDEAHDAIYVAGSFFKASNFGFGDVDAGVTSDLFALKLSPADGAPQWQKVFGGIGGDEMGGLVVDPWGRPFVTGYLQSSKDTVIDGNALPNGNAFLFMKLDPADGKALYAKGRASDTVTTSAPAMRPNGHSVMTGYFTPTLVLGGSDAYTVDGGGTFVTEIGP